MSAISITLTPGYQFSPDEQLLYSTLNLLGQPTIQLQGQLGTAQLENQSVTTPILALGAVGAAQIAVGAFGPNSATAGLFAAGALGYLALAGDLAPVRGNGTVLVTNGGTPTTQATITADAVVLLDNAATASAANAFVATGVNVTLSSGSSGANGLDTGSVANSTWYYFHVIYNPTTTTVAGLMSLSAATPTLPSGYTLFALVGAALTSGTGTFTTFRIQGRRVWVPGIEAQSANALTTGYVAASLATAIPPIAKVVYGSYKATTSTVLVASDGNGTGADATLGNLISGSFALPITTPSDVYVKVASTSGSPTLILTVTGYEF